MPGVTKIRTKKTLLWWTKSSQGQLGKFGAHDGVSWLWLWGLVWSAEERCVTFNTELHIHILLVLVKELTTWDLEEQWGQMLSHKTQSSQHRKDGIWLSLLQMWMSTASYGLSQRRIFHEREFEEMQNHLPPLGKTESLQSLEYVFIIFTFYNSSDSMKY